ncbi:uncharacterized protein LOC108032019 [Drosophila biarmipes]|uniref:uncharacterized protein LOC108032019 n=1 Tax=Drosophila biarmipes TaxID=125945 RepID=UPI001CDB08D6|nr:uncharacterized protein LOC108032019 [Drosophila biarmipes]XP_050743826.1 uncharacterized protein LOC108032019 [Drosophila biarmipes]
MSRQLNRPVRDDRTNISRLVRLIHIEHNYNYVSPKESFGTKSRLPPRRTLRQMVCSLHDILNPGQLGQLSVADLKEHVRKAYVILRRLRRFLASSRRFTDFKPLPRLEEAIVEHLAQELSCSTRFYDCPDGRRYLVVYRPGIGPNPLELRARDGDFSFGLELDPVDEATEMTRILFRKKKLYLEQKSHLDERQLAEYSCRLGRKILEQFNANSQSIWQRKRAKQKGK